MPTVTLLQRRGCRDIPCDCGCGAKIKPSDPLVVHVTKHGDQSQSYYCAACGKKIKSKERNHEKEPS